MNYSRVIRDVLDNTRQDKNNKNLINSIKSDIEKTIRDMFTNSEAPIKTEYFNLDTTDTKDIESTVSLSSTNTSFIIDNIFSLKGYHIVAKQMSDISPILSSSVINITITDSRGLEVVNSDYTIVGGNALDEVVSDLSQSDMVGMTMVVSVVSLGLNIDTINITTLSYTKVFNRLELPEYIFVPFGVSFKASNINNSANFISKEMTEEEYNRWTPYGGLNSNEIAGDVFSLDGNPTATGYTLENIEFDGRIGYFFTVVDNKLYLMFKPAILGTVAIRFSYLPLLTIDEENSIPIHNAFINGIIDGVTVRQLNKLILDVQDEISLIKIKGAISMYHESFKLTVNKFAGYNRKKTGVRSIKASDILEDPSMLIV